MAIDKRVSLLFRQRGLHRQTIQGAKESGPVQDRSENRFSGPEDAPDDEPASGHVSICFTPAAFRINLKVFVASRQFVRMQSSSFLTIRFATEVQSRALEFRTQFASMPGTSAFSSAV